MSTSDAYWTACIEAALEEAGIEATLAQIETMAECVRNGHEMYGEANGHEHIPNPLETENKRLAATIAKERSLVFCVECKGKGHITENFGIGRSSSGPCWKCHGEGKHK